MSIKRADSPLYSDPACIDCISFLDLVIGFLPLFWLKVQFFHLVVDGHEPDVHVKDFEVRCQ